jgi:hypothetical protein
LKTRPTEFKLPVKHGLYGYAYIDHNNCHDFHPASECPLNEPVDLTGTPIG